MFSAHNIQKSLCGEVPTLAQAVEAYKYINVATWMTGQLTNLCTYMGYSNMPNSTQTEAITDLFLQKYPFLRVTEVMYYFECIKDGRYYEATIKLEPQALIKGVVKYMGDLNMMKERWGNAFEDFTPEKLKNVCIEILRHQRHGNALRDVLPSEQTEVQCHQREGGEIRQHMGAGLEEGILSKNINPIKEQHYEHPDNRTGIPEHILHHTTGGSEIREELERIAQLVEL